MKNLKLIIAISAIILTATWLKPAQADASRKDRREVVILISDMDGTNTSGGFQYSGMKVYCSSSSKGAPTFPQGHSTIRQDLTETAEAMAQLRSEGYRIIHTGDNGRVVMLEK